MHVCRLTLATRRLTPRRNGVSPAWMMDELAEPLLELPQAPGRVGAGALVGQQQRERRAHQVVPARVAGRREGQASLLPAGGRHGPAAAVGRLVPCVHQRG